MRHHVDMRTFLTVALAILTLVYATPSAAQENEPATSGWSVPDALGYRYIDSRTPGGPEPVWYDGVETGVVLDLRQVGYREGVPIGFNFPFYGYVYDRFAIHTDGVVTFTRTDGSFLGANQELPGSRRVNIAAYWDDLPIGDQGRVSYRLYGRAPERSLVVQWSGGRYRGANQAGQNSPAAQLILKEDGNIYMAYAVPGTAVDRGSATIGIQNDTRSIGLTYAHNQRRVQDGLTILFARPAGAPAIAYTPPDAPGVALTGCQDEGTVLGFRRILETETGIRTRIGCPLEDEHSYAGEELFFDGGHMLRRPDKGDILVTFEDNRRWASFPDTYAGEPEPQSDITPPADRDLPQGAFGKLWRENPGLRQRIGWPVSPLNAFQGTAQEFQRGMMAFTGQGQWLRAYLDDGTTAQG